MDDGLADNIITSIAEDANGNIWLGTQKGACRYDGQRIHTLTTQDGLGSNKIRSIIADGTGYLWLQTERSGVTKSDGICFQTLSTKDGLTSNNINGMKLDPQGNIWFISQFGGVVKHVPDAFPPRVNITQAIADKEYPATQPIELPSSVKRITFVYQGTDFRTRPGQMWYLYKMEGVDDRSQGLPLPWQKPTRQEQVDYRNLPPGRYRFYVKAVDRDLNYSEPASVEVTVLPPPIYARTGFIISMILAAFFAPTAVYGALFIRQRKRSEKLFEPIPNPYIVGNPIRSKDMFFGREDDFRFIRDKLVGSPAGLTIVLAGERRSGKTSILYQIINGRLGERFVPVFIDMQAMAVRDDAEFFDTLAAETNRAINGQAPLEGYDFRSTEHPAQTFQRYIEAVMNLLDRKTLLFLIDEYELLEAKVEEETLRSDSLTFLAGLLERHPRIAFLFTGSRHLEERKAEFWRVLLPKSIARHISFLSERDTYRLIEEPIKGTVKCAKGVPEAIYRLTAGQPFYTQVVCQNLIDLLNAEERYVVGLNDVATVAREIEESPLPQMLFKLTK